MAEQALTEEEFQARYGKGGGTVLPMQLTEEQFKAKYELPAEDYGAGEAFGIPIDERRTMGAGALPMLGGAIGGLVGGVPGAGFGGIVGARGKRALLEHLGLQAPPGTPEEESAAAAETAKEGLWEGGTQAIGAGVGKVLGKMFPKRALSAESEVVHEMNERLGLGLPADAVTDSSTFGGIRRTLGETSIAGRNVAEKAKGVTKAKLEAATEGNLALIAPPGSATATGKAAVKGARAGDAAYHREGSRLYKQVSAEVDLAPIMDDIGAMRLPADLKKKLPVEFAAAQQMKDAFDRQVAAGTITPQQAAANLQQIISRFNLKVPFEVAQSMRTHFLHQANPKNIAMRSGDEGIASNAASSLFEQIKTSLAAAGPEQLRAYTKANAFYKGGAKVYEDMGEQIINKNPAPMQGSPQTVHKVVEPNNVVSVRAARSAIKNFAERYGVPEEKVLGTEAWDAFRQQWVKERILSGPKDSLPDITKNLAGEGADVAKAMFNDSRGKVFLENLRAIGTVMDRVDTLPQHRGIYIHQAIVAGLAGGALGLGSGPGNAAGLAMTAEAAPYLITKIAYSPRFTRLLVKGVSESVKTGTEQGVANAIRAIRAALDEETISPPPE